MEDAPLSDQGDANEDIQMVDAEVIEGERPDGDSGSAPRRSPDPEEVPEWIPDQLEENPDEIAGEGDPQVPKDPQDDSPQPHRQVLQGFRTVAQTFSAAYGSASSDIQQIIRRSLRESTNDDWTFIYGASNAIRRWVESVRPSMAGNDTGKDGREVVTDTKVTKDPTQLLADTQDAVDAVLDLIPEVEHKLPPVYPRIDVASALTISRHHTERALKNVHTQISDLIRTHVAGPEQPGIFQHYPADHLLLPVPDGRDGHKPTVSWEPASPQCVECPSGSLGRTISGGASELLGQLASFSCGTGRTRSRYFWSVGVSKDSN